MAVKTTEVQQPGSGPKYLADLQGALKLKHYERRAIEARRSNCHAIRSGLYGVVNLA
jgi:hypothetical protein